MVLIINEGCELRIRTPEDVISCFELIDRHRDYLKQWLPWLDSCQTEPESLTNIRQNIREFTSGSTACFGIFIAGKFAGMISFNHIDKYLRSGSVGYWLAPEHQGRGWVGKCLARLLEHGFMEHHLETVWLRANVHNLKSQKVALRAGFTLMKVQPNSEWLYDRYVDLNCYCLTRAAWENSKKTDKGER